jgi:hypothetical protein
MNNERGPEDPKLLALRAEIQALGLAQVENQIASVRREIQEMTRSIYNAKKQARRARPKTTPLGQSSSSETVLSHAYQLLEEAQTRLRLLEERRSFLQLQ